MYWGRTLLQSLGAGLARTAIVIALAGVAASTTAPAQAEDASDQDPTTASSQAVAAAAADTTESPLLVPGVGNVAHKGASVSAPENTLAAVRESIALGADFVGIDVRRTRDGQLVVLHDERLARTTNVEQVFPRRARWRVGRFTLDQIRRLDAGSWHSPAYTGANVPTLRQVLRELAPSRTGAFLEVKAPYRYGGVDGIGSQVVAELRRYTPWLAPTGPKDRLVVQAFNDRFLRSFGARYDRVVVGTIGGAAGLAGYATWADQINVHHRDVNRALVAEAHSLGLAVSTYIVNEAADMTRVVGAGVDAVSTDYPGRLRRRLRAAGRVLQDGSAAPRTPPASLTISAAERALLRTRLRLRTVVQTSDGSRARWSWVRVQHRTRDGWRSLQRRATDRHGVLRTTVRARRTLRLRVVSGPGGTVSSPTHRVETRRASTRLRLYGERRVVGAEAATLRARLVTEDRRRVSAPARLWAKPAGRRWRPIRDVRIRHGSGFRVRPSRNTRYELRARRGSWWTGDRDRHYVDHVPRRRR
jgi:glycerophosphoryl diester phosphodiesterase